MTFYLNRLERSPMDWLILVLGAVLFVAQLALCRRGCPGGGRPARPPRGGRPATGLEPMSRPPRRSVTRFFIPMIDVLTLLFCIFLLMPFVKSAGEEGADGGPAAAPPAEVITDPADVLRR